MSVSALLGWYVVVLFAALVAVAVYYGWRQRSFGPTQSLDRVFRCAGCGYVYTDDPDMDRSRCPQCGVTNEAYRF
jgi:rubrerythrin